MTIDSIITYFHLPFTTIIDMYQLRIKVLNKVNKRLSKNRKGVHNTIQLNPDSKLFS